MSLNHEEPDRVPTDFWASPGTWKIDSDASSMVREEFLNAWDVDLRYIDGPGYTGAPLDPGVDIWGVRRRISVVETPFGTEAYSEVAYSPLESVSCACLASAAAPTLSAAWRG